MRRPISVLIALSLLLLVVAHPQQQPAPPVQPPLLSSRSIPTDWTPLRTALDVKRWHETRFYLTVQKQEDAKTRARDGNLRAMAEQEARYGSGACGGDLPPCWVLQRESGGNYSAYNPAGCAAVVNGVSGRGCYGAWQFGWFWAGRLGLPDDLSTATPEQQDTAARILWNGGRGCSNWAAC